MSNDFNLKNDELDLKELAFALWAHKIFILLITGLSIFIAGYVALKTEKKFTSTAIFQINQSKNSDLSLAGDLGALASIAGLASRGGSRFSDQALLERIKAREFILSVNNKLLLYLDPYFNSYVAKDKNLHDHEDPKWKSLIKKIVGWEETEIKINDNAIIEENVIRNYNSNVKVEFTDWCRRHARAGLRCGRFRRRRGRRRRGERRRQRWSRSRRRRRLRGWKRRRRQ